MGTDPVPDRRRVALADGTHISFDLFLQPTRRNPLFDKIILIVIPGISNHSRSDYIRAYIEYASSNGFQVACLNQLGESGYLWVLRNQSKNCLCRLSLRRETEPRCASHPHVRGDRRPDGYGGLSETAVP